MDRINVASGRKWEEIVGYSRAVRVGDFVFVTGTTATDDAGHIVGVGDPYAQAAKAIDNIRWALEQAGSQLGDVVRTRIYVKHIADWEQVGRAHQEAFGSIKPATTMIEISRLIDPDMLVEIEADAIVSGGGG